MAFGCRPRCRGAQRFSPSSTSSDRALPTALPVADSAQPQHSHPPFLGTAILHSQSPGGISQYAAIGTYHSYKISGHGVRNFPGK